MSNRKRPARLYVNNRDGRHAPWDSTKWVVSNELYYPTAGGERRKRYAESNWRSKYTEFPWQVAKWGVAFGRGYRTLEDAINAISEAENEYARSGKYIIKSGD